MADDRLDDAIDAVVRAVDRIERATRSQLDAPLPEMPAGPGFGLGAEAPRTGEPAAAPAAVPAAPPAHAPAPAAPPLPAAAPPPALPHLHGAPPEVHELVGRIVARTQALEETLDEARALRSEITELVSKLASAATRPR